MSRKNPTKATRRQQKSARPPTADKAHDDGLVRLYGRHVVQAALDNPKRRAKLLLHDRPLSTEMADKLAVRSQQVATARLESEAGADAVHQGLVLLTEPLAPVALEDLLDADEALVLVLDQVTDPRNVGACLRSAAAFGVHAILSQDQHTPPETGALARAAAGGLDIVPWCRVTNLARALVQLADAAYWRVGLDGTAPTALAAIDPSPKQLLVMGAEGKGMRRLTAEKCDQLAHIPMSGAMESLNVSVAAAIALYEIRRG